MTTKKKLIFLAGMFFTGVGIAIIFYNYQHQSTTPVATTEKKDTEAQNRCFEGMFPVVDCARSFEVFKERLPQCAKAVYAEEITSDGFGDEEVITFDATLSEIAYCFEHENNWLKAQEVWKYGVDLKSEQVDFYQSQLERAKLPENKICHKSSELQTALENVAKDRTFEPLRPFMSRDVRMIIGQTESDNLSAGAFSDIEALLKKSLAASKLRVEKSTFKGIIEPAFVMSGWKDFSSTDVYFTYTDKGGCAYLAGVLYPFKSGGQGQ